MSSNRGYQSLETESGHGSKDHGSGEEPPIVHEPTSLSSVTGALVRGHGSLLTLLSVPALIALGFAILVLLVIVGFASYKYSKASGCLGAPYLYVSHWKDHNIIQLTRDGCLNMNKALYGVPQGEIEMRSMAVGQYMGEPALYVADASPKTSQVMIYGDCGYWTGMRSLRASVFNKDGPFAGGAQHAYGIAFDSAENVYTSFQHTNVVLRAAKDTFELLPLAEAPSPTTSKVGRRLDASDVDVGDVVEEKNRVREESEEANDQERAFLGGRREGPFPGTFFQFGNATVQNPQDQGVRSIVWTQSSFEEQLWINNEFDDAVYVVDSTGHVIKMITVARPVGIFHDSESADELERSLVYVGSRHDKGGKVIAFNVETFEMVREYTMIGMSHPTGIAAYDGVLFVADQTLGAILTFNLHSGRFIKNIWERQQGGDIEQIVLSHC